MTTTHANPSPTDVVTRRAVGLALIASAILINVPYAALIATFAYPDILRAPAGEVLSRFHAAGPSLIFTWLAFAWVGAPLFIAMPNLKRALLGDRASILMNTAATFGVASLVVQMVGLLRWVFVVPVLAQVHHDGDAAAQAGAVLAFQVLNQYGGVVVGEHLGSAFSIAWMVFAALAIHRHTTLPRPFVVLGVVGAAVYALSHAELLASVMPQTPVWAPAGLVGSLLWLAFMIAVGVRLLLGPVMLRPLR